MKRSCFAKYSCFGGIFVTKDYWRIIFQCRNLLQRKLPSHSPGGAANHAVASNTKTMIAIVTLAYIKNHRAPNHGNKTLKSFVVGFLFPQLSLDVIDDGDSIKEFYHIYINS